MKLLAGLGNPGATYAHTRHNVGFMVLDRVAEKAAIPLPESHVDCIAEQGTWRCTDLLLVKPLSYMNRSGEIIASVAARYNIPPHDIIIVHDDMDFPFGSLRLKQRGGSGGHRGVASIIEQLASDHFVRLRVGVGRPPAGIAGPEYVLTTLCQAERERFSHIVERASLCIETLLTNGIAAAMNQFHSAQGPDKTMPLDSPIRH